MFFRNLQVFRLALNWSQTADALNAALAKFPAGPCGAMARYTQGWVPPRGNPGEYVVAVGNQLLIALGIEQKILPLSVVRQYAQERALELEESQGHKPGRAQMREIFDAVEAELLPRAFVTRRITYAWIDLDNFWLCINASSYAKSDEVIEQLKLTLGELPLLLLKTLQAPGTAMTQWVSLGEVPGNFSIDQDCALRAPGDGGGKVKYTRHPLEAAELNQHIGKGKVVGELALTWNDRISFVLTEQLQIKRVAFLDVLKERAEQAGEGNDQLEADFVIMSGELAALLAELTMTLGGEAEAPGDGKSGDVLAGDKEADPLYQTAVDLVRKLERPSISLVQRHLQIGYNRAARLIERMEVEGIVTPQDKGGVRKLAA